MKRNRVALAAGITIATAALSGGIAVAAGSSLPRDHRASVTVDIAAPIDDVWLVVHDYGRMHHWAPESTALVRQPDAAGHRVFTLPTDDGSLTYTLVEVHRPERLVVDLTADPPDFGGRWTYELETTELGTQVTLTEEGWVEPALFRLYMWLAGAEDDTLEQTATALKQHLEG